MSCGWRNLILRRKEMEALRTLSCHVDLCSSLSCVHMPTSERFNKKSAHLHHIHHPHIGLACNLIFLWSLHFRGLITMINCLLVQVNPKAFAFNIDNNSNKKKKKAKQVMILYILVEKSYFHYSVRFGLFLVNQNSWLSGRSVGPCPHPSGWTCCWITINYDVPCDA